MIRTARQSDLEQLRDIEVAAGEMFRTLGMDRIADDEPPSFESLAGYQSGGRLWVATNTADAPIAYIAVDEVDGKAHIEQVTVHPAHAGQRLGADLIGEAAKWAQACGISFLTLTTFEHVPWNAPYYERLGFEIVPEDEWGQDMQMLVAHEAAHGLNQWSRVVMDIRV